MSDLFEFLPPVDFRLDRDREGKSYKRRFDYARLNGQARAVWDVVKDGRWRSLAEIASSAGAPEASVSARLRDFRKLGVRVDRKRIKGGLFYYRVSLRVIAGNSGGDEGDTTKDHHG